MLRGLVLLVLLASPALAAPPLATERSITASAGVVLPFFLLYERPGALISTSVAWRTTERTQLVASGELGMLVASGATRFSVRWAVIPNERVEMLPRTWQPPDESASSGHALGCACAVERSPAFRAAAQTCCPTGGHSCSRKMDDTKECT